MSMVVVVIFCGGWLDSQLSARVAEQGTEEYHESNEAKVDRALCRWNTVSLWNSPASASGAGFAGCMVCVVGLHEGNFPAFACNK